MTGEMLFSVPRHVYSNDFTSIGFEVSWKCSQNELDDKNVERQICKFAKNCFVRSTFTSSIDCLIHILQIQTQTVLSEKVSSRWAILSTVLKKNQISYLLYFIVFLQAYLPSFKRVFDLESNSVAINNSSVLWKRSAFRSSVWFDLKVRSLTEIDEKRGSHLSVGCKIIVEIQSSLCGSCIEYSFFIFFRDQLALLVMAKLLKLHFRFTLFNLDEAVTLLKWKYILYLYLWSI